MIKDNMREPKKICTMISKGFEFDVYYIDVYNPWKRITQFTKKDVDSRKVICSASGGIVETNLYRVVLKIETTMNNYLGKIPNDEEIKFFNEIKSSKEIQEYVKEQCSEECEIVIYYEADNGAVSVGRL